MTIIAVSMLILIHEFGHFVCAKAVGMRVEVFSIGFWKRLVGFKLGDTDYRISLIPLGGYVKVTGESPEEGRARASRTSSGRRRRASGRSSSWAA